MQAAIATHQPESKVARRLRTMLGRALGRGDARRAFGVGAGYQLGRRLDHGGTDEVYEAVHPQLAGRLAIKLHRRALATDAVALAEFRRDAALVSSLRHPHCVQVIELGATREGVPFVAMEYLEGRTLEDHLAGRRSLPSPAEAVAWIKAIATALAAAHASNVIHGGLRPGRVFLAEAAGFTGGFVKLFDFGVRRLAGQDSGAGTIAEAARFTAPELAPGTASTQPDGRADQFALAAIAYRLLAGVDAFPGDDATAVLARVRKEAPRPLARTAGCDQAVDAVIRKGLAKDLDKLADAVLAGAMLPADAAEKLIA